MIEFRAGARPVGQLFPSFIDSGFRARTFAGSVSFRLDVVFDCCRVQTQLNPTNCFQGTTERIAGRTLMCALGLKILSTAYSFDQIS